MNERQTRKCEQLLGIITFLDQHARTLTPELRDTTGRLRALLEQADAIDARGRNASVLDMVRIAADQRRSLRIRHLIPLSRQARRAFRDDPLVLERLRVPHKNASADEIVAAGEGMLEALQSYRAQLDLVQVDVTRLDRLRAALDRFDVIRQRSIATIPARRGDARELRELFSRARAEIVAVDGAIRAEHEHLLDLWRSVFRLPKRRGRPRRRSSSRQPAGLILSEHIGSVRRPRRFRRP